MFFVLSKTLGLLVEPLVIPYILLALAMLARWSRRRRIAFWLGAVGFLLPVSYCFLPLSTLPLQFLENRIPRGDINSPHIDGIIVLGGFTGNSMVAESRQTYGLSSSAERFTAALALAHDRPSLPIVFSGFSGKLIPDGWSEADQIRDLVARLGGLGRTVLYEEQSRNTYENAVNSREVLAASAGSRWILVTSASHMPRAIGSFTAAGWTGLIPYPVDYQTMPTGADGLWGVRGISRMRNALHEYAGLLVYYLTGRSHKLLPD